MRREWKQTKLYIKQVLDNPQVCIWEKIIIIESILEFFRKKYDIV